MISVGLDVPRLGLMTVSGQPKTTSEYIQATSRVGRDAKKGAGLVFVLLRPGKPRDKSHYEHFKSYHSRIYCNVEPTSVTPFSAPIRERALPAVMIAMIRLEKDEKYNSSMPKIPDDDFLNHVEEIIKRRVTSTDNTEIESTIKRMEKIIKTWKNRQPEKWEPVRKRPGAPYEAILPLMFGAGTTPNPNWGQGPFQVPTSMRNVDAECQASVINDYPLEDSNDEFES